MMEVVGILLAIVVLCIIVIGWRISTRVMAGKSTPLTKLKAPVIGFQSQDKPNPPVVFCVAMENLLLYLVNHGFDPAKMKALFQCQYDIVDHMGTPGAIVAYNEAAGYYGKRRLSTVPPMPSQSISTLELSIIVDICNGLARSEIAAKHGVISKNLHTIVKDPHLRSFLRANHTIDWFRLDR